MSWVRKEQGSANWYLCWREGSRKRLRLLRTRDRVTAEKIRRHFDNERPMRRAGMPESGEGVGLRGGEPGLADMGAVQIGDFLKWRRRGGGRTLADVTVAMEARHWRAFFNWCLRRGWIGENPMRTIPRVRRQAEHVLFLSADEVRLLLSGERSADLRDLYRWMLLTGARTAETCALTWGNIDETAGLILLPAANRKRGRRHEVEMSHTVRVLLDQRRARL